MRCGSVAPSVRCAAFFLRKIRTLRARLPAVMWSVVLVALVGTAGTARAQLLDNPPGSDTPAAEQQAPAEKIVEIRVEGNRRVEAEAVKRALKQKVGEPFDGNRTGDDLRSLW